MGAPLGKGFALSKEAPPVSDGRERTGLSGRSQGVACLFNRHWIERQQVRRGALVAGRYVFAGRRAALTATSLYAGTSLAGEMFMLKKFVAFVSIMLLALPAMAGELSTEYFTVNMYSDR